MEDNEGQNREVIVKQYSENDNLTLIWQYLLNRLSEDLRQNVEDRLMTDKIFAEQLRMAEGELCDEYAAGRLQGADRESFERLFLVQPELRRQVEFAQALHRYVLSKSAAQVGAGRRESSWRALVGCIRAQSFGFRAALAAACMAIVLGGGWLLLEVNRLQDSLDSLRALQEQAAKDQLDLVRELGAEENRRLQAEQELAYLKAKETPENRTGVPANFLAVVLQSGLVRDAGSTPQIMLPADKDGARLELALENDSFPRYEAVLEMPEGAQVFKQSGLSSQKTSRGPAVFVQLSREILKPQDYILRLTGIAADGSRQRAGTYYFRIASK